MQFGSRKYPHIQTGREHCEVYKKVHRIHQYLLFRTSGTHNKWPKVRIRGCRIYLNATISIDLLCSERSLSTKPFACLDDTTSSFEICAINCNFTLHLHCLPFHNMLKTRPEPRGSKDQSLPHCFLLYLLTSLQGYWKP